MPPYREQGAPELTCAFTGSLPVWLPTALPSVSCPCLLKSLLTDVAIQINPSEPSAGECEVPHFPFSFICYWLQSKLRFAKHKQEETWLWGWSLRS